MDILQSQRVSRYDEPFLKTCKNELPGSVANAPNVGQRHIGGARGYINNRGNFSDRAAADDRWDLNAQDDGQVLWCNSESDVAGYLALVPSSDCIRHCVRAMRKTSRKSVRTPRVIQKHKPGGTDVSQTIREN